MNPIRAVFFGSTDDSLLVLNKLFRTEPVSIGAVVTQPARPVGRKQVMTPTPVEVWAKAHDVDTLTFPTSTVTPWEYENEQTVIDTLQPVKADVLVSASYGQKIPSSTIRDATYGGLNVHPSLLPKWRGTDPVPWTIMSGDRQTGVTIVTLSTNTFDAGAIIAQKKIPVMVTDSTIPLRRKLFTVGGELLIESLPDYLTGKNKGVPQKIRGEPYAKRLTRDDGFEPWEYLLNPREAERINRKFRALNPWPGLWTRFQGKRLKILSFDTTPVLVQLEGKKPVSWKQFENAYVPKTAY